VVDAHQRTMKERTKVFISYSHEDEKWVQRLRVHLKPLTRLHKIEIWDDTKIQAGSKWQDNIQEAMDGALVAVLMISANYLASDFVVNDELPHLLKAAEVEGATILLLILSPCGFKNETLYRFQAVNNPDEPLINVSEGEQEAVFARVAESIEAAFSARKVDRELSQVHQRLDDLLGKLAKLFTHTMSGPMYENLCKLASPEGFGDYKMRDGLQRELYHLRDIGYIKAASIRNIPREGSNLSDYVRVLSTGKEFIQLREAMSDFLSSKESGQAK
jgi:hypothetical protein